MQIVAENRKTGQLVTLAENLKDRTGKQRNENRQLVTQLRSEIEKNGWTVYAK